MQLPASLKHACVDMYKPLHPARERMLSCDVAARANNTRSPGKPFESERDGEGESSAGNGWMDGGREGTAARDAEGGRRCIHSSSGIYSRPEERREQGAWLGLWLSHCFTRQRGRRGSEWEERGSSGASERGEAIWHIWQEREERKEGGRAVFECLCVCLRNERERTEGGSRVLS